MDEVTMDKAEFIKRVTANRDAHRDIFLKAVEGYRKQLLAILEERIEDVRMGKRIETIIRLPEPKDHTGDYDRVLLMADLSLTDTVTISDHDFAQYIMDEWGWKEDFIKTSRSYGVRE